MASLKDRRSEVTGAGERVKAEPWGAILAIARALALSAWAGGAILACGEDCSQAARLGDFEFSQGNYPNAIRQYEKALRIDAKCGVVADKLAEAKRKASPAAGGK